MAAHVVRADARCLPLPDASVDLIVTSPPFFALRSYQDAGEHYDGQLGDEATPGEFLDALIDCTRDWIRVLKPSGSLWVNLGDKYGRRQNTNVRQTKHGPAAAVAYPSRVKPSDMPKSLLGVPWRYAIRCTDELGLTLRAEVIWDKPNGLPESVTDRVRRSHETWFHFVLDPFGYFSAVDEIREPHTWQPSPGYKGHRAQRAVTGQPTHRFAQGAAGAPGTQHPLGRLPGSVWQVVTEPLLAPAVSPLDGRPLPDHFAAFPTEWPRRIIAAWSPAGICTRCGEGRRPVVVKPGLLGGDNNPFSRDGSRARSMMDGGAREWAQRSATPDYISGYTCACDGLAPTRPAMVLDPCGGTGTTALVADVLGRTGVSVDLSHDYGRLARWRTTDPSERARAMRVEKPPVQVRDQAALW